MASTLDKDDFRMPVLEERHLPSGFNSSFHDAGKSFSDYVDACREMLLKAHAGKTPAARERAVSGNAPFELRPAEDAPRGQDRPYRRGVVLAHGLTDSPYFMRPLAEFFQAQGFRVMAILLPGHGTQPGDLLEVAWQEWAHALAYGVDQMSLEADEVYVGGYSAGATLAVRHSLMDARVRGIFLFSPALKISMLAAFANLHRLYGWLWPRARWVNVSPDADMYKYESLTKNAAFQMHALIKDMHSRMRSRQIDIPVFAAASADDATVESAATVSFMAQTRHALSRLVYYTTEPHACPAGIPASRIELVDSRVPEQHIVSFSHVSLLLPPEDPHYGIAGDYSNCLHYYPEDMEKYAICRGNRPPVLQGEVTERALRGAVLRRLTYNPHFRRLETSLGQFIESLP